MPIASDMKMALVNLREQQGNSLSKLSEQIVNLLQHSVAPYTSSFYFLLNLNPFPQKSKYLP